MRILPLLLSISLLVMLPVACYAEPVTWETSMAAAKAAEQARKWKEAIVQVQAAIELASTFPIGDARVLDGYLSLDQRKKAGRFLPLITRALGTVYLRLPVIRQRAGRAGMHK